MSCQRSVTESSQSGMLHLLTSRPVLEVKIIDKGETTNILFERASTYLDLMVINTGNAVAEQCWLTMRAEPRTLIIYDDQLSSFNIFPEDTIYKRVKIEARDRIDKEPVKITIDVEERNGYNLYPPRTVNFFIQDKPEFDIAVVDVAALDQNRIGYFDMFQNVDLFFRIQNCGNVPFNNVSANFEMLGRTSIASGNPNRVIGRMEVGETSDIQIQVNTGMGAENVSVRLNINADDSSYSEEYRFEFLTDYKGPNDMIADGCADYMPTITTNLTDVIDFENLPPKSLNNNKIAIIVSNQNYFDLSDLPYAAEDARQIIDMLAGQLGFNRENIFHFPNLRHDQFVALFDFSTVEFDALRRRITRGRESRDIHFFFIGRGAADLVNGEIFLLPIDFIEYGFVNRYPLSQVFKNFKDIMDNNAVLSITSYLNINYSSWSNTGNKNEMDFLIREFHTNEPGFTTFVSSPVFQSAEPTADTNISPFSEVLIQGLQGLADFNQNGIITSSQLYRLMTDEIMGVPGRAWSNNNYVQVPLLFGEERIMY